MFLELMEGNKYEADELTGGEAMAVRGEADGGDRVAVAFQGVDIEMMVLSVLILRYQENKFYQEPEAGEGRGRARGTLSVAEWEWCF